MVKLHILYVFCILFVCTNSEMPEEQINLCKFAMVLPDNKSLLFHPSTTFIDGDHGDQLMLSSYIEKGDLIEGRRLSLVNATHMAKEAESSHAGFITVDKRFNSNLWFWYFPIQGGHDPKKAPLIIWLDGGPGTSFFYHFFEKIGLFYTTDNGTKIVPNPYNWHSDHSILYIDSPVGTGFSFTDHEDGYASNETQISEQLYIFLEQFGKLFPELRSAPIFIVGQSYAGKYIPALVHQIHVRNPTAQHKLNLVGLGIGNGWIDPVNMLDYSSFLYYIGFADEKLSDEFKEQATRTKNSLLTGNMRSAVRNYYTMMQTIMYNCDIMDAFNFVKPNRRNTEVEYIAFVARPEIRKALNVGNTTFSDMNFIFCKLIDDLLKSTKPWLEEALEHYKVLLYSGNLDFMVPYASSVLAYRTMNWSGSDEFLNAERQSWFIDGRASGFYKIAGNLKEVMVRSSGHNVPGDQPEAALDLIKSLTQRVEVNINNDSISEFLPWDVL